MENEKELVNKAFDATSLAPSSAISEAGDKGAAGGEGEASATKKTLGQVIKFAMVGVVNTIVSYVVNMVCFHGFGIHEQISNLIAFVVSVFEAFLLQSRFVFKEEESKQKRVWWKVLLKTYASYAFSGLFLTAVLLYVWVDVVHVGEYIKPLIENYFMWVPIISSKLVALTNNDLAVTLAPILNMFITIPINFVINKFWAYRQKDKK